MSKNTREQCRKPALKISRTQKCGFHGGRGSGKQTAEGRARIGAAHRIHGKETDQIRAERSQEALKMAQLEDVAHAIGLITSAKRTSGRKPTGYQPIRTLQQADEWCFEDMLRKVKSLLHEE